MKLNINSSVKVRLTDHGRKIHKQEADALGMGGRNYRPPVEDEQGWSRWQLWDLMSVFDHSIDMGCELPFETTIDVEPAGPLVDENTTAGGSDDWLLSPSLTTGSMTSPPSLKEQALGLIDSNSPYLDDAAMSIIRRALEALDD